ncbi:MAG: peptidase M6 [Bryobacteraceae bacterium]|jgi:M6 family metalloprotease-like protein
MRTFIVLLTLSAGAALAQTAPPPPIDPQKVQDQDTMTWADYHPIPGVDWADPKLVPARKQFKVALVAVDFPDQPFVITLPKHSDLFGNPQIDPVAREKVPQFYADFYNTPSAVNHGHTINGYWMEQSRGQIGIAKLDAFGPYRMPKNLYQYGLNEYNQQSAAPAGFPANGRIEPDADALWAADAGADIKKKYDIVIRIYAGYDETSVWQEFGEMKFQTKEDIPAEWGSPDPAGPRWVVTRYEPWTSWRAGAQQWGLSSVRQGESSGTITHEIVHFAFSVGDNNNNPYEPPYPRAGSGPWDIMDRGSFNGPGGPHRRWVVPAAEGASMPAGLMLRSKIRFKFLRDDAVLALTRSGLAASGLAVGTVVARAADPPPGQLSGITIHLDGPAPGDHTPPQNYATNPVSSGDTLYNFYSIEVVERIGYDSFTPDNGVLISKNLDQEQRSRAFHPFTYVIDAHPEDINMVDFKRPHGEPVMRTVADYRQLNDALFHAGLNSGSQFEWEDTPNRLHFYIVDLHKDSAGVLSYTVGVRSLDGAGPQSRGVSLTPAANCTFTLANTGAPDSTDIYRLSASAQGPAGATAQIANALAAVKAGRTQVIPVYVTGAPSTVTLRAQSESDPGQATTATCTVRR